jgi:hypothetical protein
LRSSRVCMVSTISPFSIDAKAIMDGWQRCGQHR